jgi:hypothetical protein
MVSQFSPVRVSSVAFTFCVVAKSMRSVNTEREDMTYVATYQRYRRKDWLVRI